MSNDAQQKYTSRTALLYKEKLSQASSKAMRLYGTKVNNYLHFFSLKKYEFLEKILYFNKMV